MNIPLRNRKGETVAHAIVDAADYDWLMQWRWCLRSDGYVVRGEERNGKCKTIRLHRQIVNCPADMEVDHINGDALDNRKANLRICTRTENMQNRPKKKTHSAITSGYAGVSWNAQANKWQAAAGSRNARRYLGLFTDEVEAAKQYDRKARELFGEFARLNFPSEVPA